MGQHKKLVNYFGEHYPAELENYLEFFAKAMMYATNENRVTIYEMAYGREFDPDDIVAILNRNISKDLQLSERTLSAEKRRIIK